MHELRFLVPDMSCGHCTAAVRAALEAVPGVSEADVSLDTKIAIILSSSPLETSQIEEIIRGAGYTPSPVSAEGAG
jgi:copper chaperone